MRVALCSDVHLEFGQLVLENTENAHVLILSGDICVARDLMLPDPHNIVDFGKSKRYHEFFSNCADIFPHVVYIVGNHEHYHGDFADTIPHLRKCLGHLTNLHILDKEIFEIDDTVFVGGTLWTDMNKEDPLTLHSISRMMNDFRCVDHRKMLDYIRIIYEGLPPWKQMVVVGHHTPSQFSCHPKYAGDYLMNGGYHSDLSEFILDRPGIKLWTHGHTHEKFDYEIGDCRVVCNPRGYIGYEEIADEFKLKVVEL